MRYSIVNQCCQTDRNIKLSVRRTIEQRLKQVFHRVANRILRVSIVLTDENGPLGGEDKCCRVLVILRGLGTATTTGRHGNLLTAVDLAIQRARRIILKQIKRRVTRARQQPNEWVEEKDSFYEAV